MTSRLAGSGGRHAQLDSSLSALSPEMVQEISETLDFILDEFSGADESFFDVSIISESNNTRSLAFAGEDGIIFNASNMNRSDRLNTTNMAAGSASGVAAHEAGHQLERSILQKETGSQRGFDNSRSAENIMNRASAKTGISASSVSKQAARSSREALAECVSDYVCNGNSANALSKAVWSELKERLN